MTGRFVAAWLGAVGMLVSGAGLWVSPTPPTTDPASVRPAAPEVQRPAVEAGVQGTARASNPFRADGSYATTRYRPLDSLSTSTVVPIDDPGPVPGLVLEGVVAGPMGGAIVRGVPAVNDAVLIRVGESAHGFQITAMRSDTVWLSGHGSTWQLVLRRPW